MTHIRLAKVFPLIACAVLGLSRASATTCVENLQKAIEKYQNSAKSDSDKASLRTELLFGNHPNCFVAAILQNSEYQMKVPIQPTDAQLSAFTANVKAAFQQTGSNSGSGGSTNIVSQGVAARVLALATDYGALTESVSGQTVTVSGSLAGLPTFLEKATLRLPCGTIPSPNCISPNTLNQLGRFHMASPSMGARDLRRLPGQVQGRLPRPNRRASAQTINP